MKNKKGISLIALVITIIVLIILTTTVILVFKEGGTVDKAKEAAFKSDFSNILDSFTLNKTNKMLSSLGNVNNINATTEGDLKSNIPVLEKNFNKEINGYKYYQLIQIKDSVIYQSNLLVESKKNGDEKDDKISRWLEDIGIYNFMDKVKETAKKDPNQTKSDDIAIGTDGNPVNLDLWSYTKTNYTNKENYAIITDKSKFSNSNEWKGYVGEIVNGRIVGSIPQYIKFDGDNDFEEVKDISYIFHNNKELIYAPVIPSTVTNMVSAFRNCTSLVEAPVLPLNITSLEWVFDCCSKLKTAPTIPNNVKNLQSTFSNCKELSEPPIIPNSVEKMSSTFSNCIKLKDVPNIPDSVTDMGSTFNNCTVMIFPSDFKLPPEVKNLETTFYMTNITQMPIIPEKVTNMHATFAFCFNLTNVTNIPSTVINLEQCFQGCKAVTGDLIINANELSYGHCFDRTATNDGTLLKLSGTSNKLNEILSTKSSNSNIEIKQAD